MSVVACVADDLCDNCEAKFSVSTAEVDSYGRTLVALEANDILAKQKVDDVVDVFAVGAILASVCFLGQLLGYALFWWSKQK